MNKITIKDHVLTEIERTIELPYFSKNVCFWYKITSEKNVIKVLNSTFLDVSISQSTLGQALDKTTKCTENEFLENFNLVMNIFIKQTQNEK